MWCEPWLFQWMFRFIPSVCCSSYPKIRTLECLAARWIVNWKLWRHCWCSEYNCWDIAEYRECDSGQVEAWRTLQQHDQLEHKRIYSVTLTCSWHLWRNPVACQKSQQIKEQIKWRGRKTNRVQNTRNVVRMDAGHASEYNNQEKESSLQLHWNSKGLKHAVTNEYNYLREWPTKQWSPEASKAPCSL